MTTRMDSPISLSRLCRSIVAATVLSALTSVAHAFTGLESPTLSAVTQSSGTWGLKIVVLDVGQADAILILTPNGDVCLVDSGKTKSAGNRVADYLATKALNGIGSLKTIDLLYTTHYDADHLSGLPRLVERGITIRKAFDQGLSQRRKTATSSGRISAYGKYVVAVGDPNDNLQQDDDEPNFVRHRMHYGHVETIGLEGQVEIRTVSVRGDTQGAAHDIDLDPASKDINENPGSIALLIRLGDFEFYTAGDQTDDDWKPEPAVEEAVLDSRAIPGGNDIDVLKVNHHGSDTSTSEALAEKMVPEVAIISAKFTGHDKLPKKITLQQFQRNQAYVLITGDGTDPDTQDYTSSSATSENDSFTASDEAVFNNQGNVTVLVSGDGTRYTVIGNSFAKTFSTKDTDNKR